MASMYKMIPSQRKRIIDMTDSELRIYKREKLAYQRRKQFILRFLATLILVLGLTCSLHAIASKATSNVDDAKFQYFNTYTVEYGDSLWSIAQEQDLYGYSGIREYVNAVATLNHLDIEGTIKSGQVIVLPYYTNVYH